MSGLLESISGFEDRARRLERRLADPAVASAPGEYAQVAKELAGLRPLVDTAARYRAALEHRDDARALVADPDPEVSELASAELVALETQVAALEQEIRLLLVPKDPNDEKNVMLEIRAGTGGDEAALFAADLLRMYTRYAERHGWKLEPLSISQSTGGGVKEAVAAISGDKVYSRLKYERGVHRVQRVPATEAQGRIHTSTVTVAVLPEAEEVDIQIDPKELRIDVFRSSGPGGQSVNTTDSAVRITHLPSGMVVQCQDEKSQHKNKARALKILRSRLLELEQEKQAGERASARRAQVGSGERSEKMRTYNFPQSRLTDHRAGVTLHKLEAILDGDLEELLDAIHVEMAARNEAARSSG
jgi:peptide chain release factor 1